MAAAKATQQITGRAQAVAEAEARAAEPTFEQRMLEAEMQNDAKEIERKAADDLRSFMVDMAKVKQDDRDAELQAASDVLRLKREGETVDVKNFVSLVQAMQNVNQQEQQRDAGTKVA